MGAEWAECLCVQCATCGCVTARPCEWGGAPRCQNGCSLNWVRLDGSSFYTQSPCVPHAVRFQNVARCLSGSGRDGGTVGGRAGRRWCLLAGESVPGPHAHTGRHAQTHTEARSDIRNTQRPKLACLRACDMCALISFWQTLLPARARARVFVFSSQSCSATPISVY